MCVDVSTVIAGDVQSDSVYVAFKDGYSTRLSLSVSGDKVFCPIQKLWSVMLALRMLIVCNVPENGCKVLFIQCSTFSYFCVHFIVVTHMYINTSVLFVCAR